MPNKQFTERLNQELNEIGLPEAASERVAAFAKLLHIPRFKAASILNGQIIPDTPLLKVIADELEINCEWLIGKSDDKTN